jgi:CRISPR-associated protein (TIGR03986 family)
MPGKPDKPHRIRVGTLDGKPRDQRALNKLKSKELGMPHLDLVSSNVANEFIVCAYKEAHIEQVRAKLAGAGLEEVPGGDTTIAASAPPTPNTPPPRHGGAQSRGGSPQRGGHQKGLPAPAVTTNAQPLPGKPYGFVALPEKLTSAAPVWHDGTSSTGRLSGEIRFELETLTPLLVGWERQQINDAEEPWRVSAGKVSHSECAEFLQTAAQSVYPDAHDTDDDKRRKKQQKVEEDRRKYVERVQDHIVDVQVQTSGRSIDSKSVLCPLRAPWGKRPVIIPGDSLKGLLRHELGALLGAPMERVAERSYSYRPNALFPRDPNPRLIARLARVPDNGVETKVLDGNHQVRVPKTLELLPSDLRYDRRREQTSNYYRFDDGNGAPYRGGQGAGAKLNSKRNLHRKLTANPSGTTESAKVSEAVQEGYLATLRHLVDLDHGHFSERHPDVPKTVAGDAARARILEAATTVVFQPGDLIWVEWDTDKKCIVSLGWHYYYRWAYTDSVRGRREGTRARKEGGYERHGLFPLDDERAQDADGAPKALSPVRRLFGYTGDNDGSAGIGERDHAQLMGRVAVNAALEVVEESDTDDARFLKPTFLKELGMPRPSAVEHYLQQTHHPKSRRSDRATLMTYGDAVGYDTPGELAGRKFYLDRRDAYTGEPWKDDSPANRANDRSALAIEAAKPNRRFRFTVRFCDLDASELAAILVAFCPHQFRAVLGGTHADGYCSKLGNARPLGWGTVRIEAKALLLLNVENGAPVLKPEGDLGAWVRKNHQETSTQEAWLAVHRHKHPDAADYPRRDGNIYTFHTTLRAEHSRNRRYKNDGTR